MNLTLYFSGSCTPDGMAFTFHVDAEDGTRWAEQSGELTGHPPGARSDAVAAWEALLAGLEWLHALQVTPIRSLSVRATSAEVDALAATFAPDDESALSRAAACLSLFRKCGMVVTVGPDVPVVRRDLPPVFHDSPPPAAPKKSPRPHSDLHLAIRSALLREPADSSDHHIADVVGCHRSPVMKVRCRMTEEGLLSGKASAEGRYKQTDYQKWVTGKGKRPVR